MKALVVCQKMQCYNIVKSIEIHHMYIVLERKCLRLMMILNGLYFYTVLRFARVQLFVTFNVIHKKILW